MRRYLLMLMIVCVWLVATDSLVAARTLTLEESVQIATERSTAVGISRENLQTSRQDVLRNYGNVLPNATLNGYAGRNFVGPSPSVFVDAQGRAVDQAGFDHEFYSFSLNSNWMLFDWGSSIKTINSSKRTAEAASYDLQYQKSLITAQVIRAYYDVVRNENLRVVQEESVRAAERNLEQVEAFYRIGSNTQADVLQAKVRLGNTQLQLITARNNEELARATFASSLNFPLNEDIDVDSSLDIVPVDPDFMQEVEYMLTHRPDLKASRQRVTASNDQFDAAQNTRWPTLAAAFQYGWNEREFPENGNFFKENYSWNVGVSLNFNIFDRYATKSSIMSAKAQRRIAEYNLQQSKLDAILEVKRISLSLKEAEERIRVSRNTVEQATESVRLAEERYRVGAGTILESIDAAVSLTQARSSLVQAQCDHLAAKADLLRATGRPVVGK